MLLLTTIILTLVTLLGSSGASAQAQKIIRNAITPPLPAQTKVAFIAPNYQPEANKKAAAPSYVASAKAAAIYDVTSGELLYEKNIDTALPMASLTKLMTVLVILTSHQNLDEVVTIPEGLPALGVADQKIGVSAGEQFKLRDLLNATLIYSANDVANSLAIWDSGSTQKFADEMNQQAEVWNLANSKFKNPTGLDQTGHNSSVKDLLTLSGILLQSPKVREIVNTEKATIYSQSGKPYVLTTTNHDLSLPGVYGLKTGQTDLAGQCLILLGRNKDGHEILTVVLNSPDRFLESKAMVDYTFANYVWQ